MIEISLITCNMAGQKSPREEFGSPSLDFCGAILFVGLFAGHFAGLSPVSFSPAKGTERARRRREGIISVT